MVIAQDLKPALSRRAMGIDQCLRVDLEMLFGSIVNIARRPRLDNPRASP